MFRTRRQLLLVALALLLPAALSACGGAYPDLALAPVEQLREDMQHQDDEVRISYQLALANPAVLSQIPCYCG